MIVKKSTGGKVDKLRKLIHRVFKCLHLRVKINSNIRQVDFLDITLNLVLNNFQPFLKNNVSPINPNSNHPTSVIKHIPSSVERHINQHSSSKNHSISTKLFITKSLLSVATDLPKLNMWKIIITLQRRIEGGNKFGIHLHSIN